MRNIDVNPFSCIFRITGFASAKVGRWVAFTVGGAIILLEIANEQGVIKIDWNKLNQKADKIGDKVQEAVTGEGPKILDKVIELIKSKRKFYLNSDLRHSYSQISRVV